MLPLKALRDDKENIEETTVSLVVAKEICLRCGRAVLSEQDGIFTLREEKRIALGAVFSSLLTGFGKSFGKEKKRGVHSG